MDAWKMVHPFTTILMILALMFNWHIHHVHVHMIQLHQYSFIAGIQVEAPVSIWVA